MQAIPKTASIASTSMLRGRLSVRPSIRCATSFVFGRSGGRRVRLSRGDDERVDELPEARTQGKLADRRLATQPREVRDHIAFGRLELLPRRDQAVDVVLRGRDTDGLGEREEREQEAVSYTHLTL